MCVRQYCAVFHDLGAVADADSSLATIAEEAERASTAMTTGPRCDTWNDRHPDLRVVPGVGGLGHDVRQLDLGAASDSDA